jgi:hypothetical protein
LVRLGHIPRTPVCRIIFFVQAEDLDDLVQRLAVAKYALAAGDEATAAQAVDAALALARHLMTRDHGDSLLRTRPAHD